MLARLAPLILAPLIASCQPPDIAVHAAFFGNALTFVAADSGDSDSSLCWREGIVVDDSLRPVWRFSGPGTGQCGETFPLFYGRAPKGTVTEVEATRLEPGRLYLFIGDATAGVTGAFSLTRAGSARIIHNVDPDWPAAAALRQAWWQREVPPVADRPPSAGAGG